MAATLSVLVFNDMLSTSHTIECEQEIKYGMELMLIDLTNFLLLALALIIISPQTNLFDVPLARIATRVNWSFWLLLTAYWLLLIWWTHIWQKRAGQPIRTRVLQFTVAMAFFLEWAIVILLPGEIANIGRVVVLAYLVVYLCVIRQWARTKRAKRAGAII